VCETEDRSSVLVYGNFVLNSDGSFSNTALTFPLKYGSCFSFISFTRQLRVEEANISQNAKDKSHSHLSYLRLIFSKENRKFMNICCYSYHNLLKDMCFQRLNATSY
jgi:hypothetical protein